MVYANCCDTNYIFISVFFYNNNLDNTIQQLAPESTSSGAQGGQFYSTLHHSTPFYSATDYKPHPRAIAPEVACEVRNKKRARTS